MTTPQYPNIWAAARFYAEARYVRRDLNGSCPGESAAARRMYRPSIASRLCPLPAMGTYVSLSAGYNIRSLAALRVLRRRSSILVIAGLNLAAGSA